MDRRFQIWAIWLVTLGIFFLLVAAYLRQVASVGWRWSDLKRFRQPLPDT
jgi:hypothetical protein